MGLFESLQGIDNRALDILQERERVNPRVPFLDIWVVGVFQGEPLITPLCYRSEDENEIEGPPYVSDFSIKGIGGEINLQLFDPTFELLGKLAAMQAGSPPGKFGLLYRYGDSVRQSDVAHASITNVEIGKINRFGMEIDIMGFKGLNDTARFIRGILYLGSEDKSLETMLRNVMTGTMAEAEFFTAGTLRTAYDIPESYDDNDVVIPLQAGNFPIIGWTSVEFNISPEVDMAWTSHSQDMTYIDIGYLNDLCGASATMHVDDLRDWLIDYFMEEIGLSIAWDDNEPPKQAPFDPDAEEEEQEPVQSPDVLEITIQATAAKLLATSTQENEASVARGTQEVEKFFYNTHVIPTPMGFGTSENYTVVKDYSVKFAAMPLSAIGAGGIGGGLVGILAAPSEDSETRETETVFRRYDEVPSPPETGALGLSLPNIIQEIPTRDIFAGNPDEIREYLDGIFRNIKQSHGTTASMSTAVRPDIKIGQIIKVVVFTPKGVNYLLSGLWKVIDFESTISGGLATTDFDLQRSSSEDGSFGFGLSEPEVVNADNEEVVDEEAPE